MRTIGVITVGRSDYGYYRPILQGIDADPSLQLRLIVAGMHLSPDFGLTVNEIEADQYEIAERVEMLLSADTPSGIAKSIGLGIIGFSQVYARLRPDLLLLLGDRFEMLAAATAMLPFARPIAHIAGGELTEGLIDDAIRHSLTKMSHLHFVSTERYRQRVIQMGEEPWRVIVSGAPSLDNLASLELLTQSQLKAEIGFFLQPAPLLATFHPVTLEYEYTSEHIGELIAALDMANLPVVFTFPNADTQNHTIIEEVQGYVDSHDDAHLTVNLGTRRYYSLMKYALAIIGNSSSGIIEAASFRLPVINIGDRQRGRIHGPNVLDVPCERTAILHAIDEVRTAEFRGSLKDLVNPYGDCHATERIVQVLSKIELNQKLLLKRFYDLPGER